MRLELTRRGDYGLRAMLALARTTGEPLSARRIAAEQAVPERFLRLVMADLAGAGLVTASTGRRGGYRLAKPASSVSMLDVIHATEGDPRRRTCVLRNGPCRTAGTCEIHAVFAEAQEALLASLAGVSLADVGGPGVSRGSPG